ncbi:hypothetical protein [Ureibacillus sinduriensis]|uniref:LysM domain-containing protein n=1 Tax=Ureibacillus sinduriensis BLB-1 = JCM 15800 TaxID=1384057 RepID=A0A0A3HPS1_9BACL|nr:hypothetical protein [Ureibacillus sinduriensis]KGR74576.1 hypothetical protein CD33_15895 [Ureibacillus sinduriensis BLB-1 = JCM 15800]
MRFLIFTAVFFLIAAVIKIDLTEGTVPLAAFDKQQAVEVCEQQIAVKTLSVVTAAGDTVQSLLAAYPSEVDLSYPERMAQFYKLNPHLQKQAMVTGELIKIPIYDKIENNC